MTDDVISIHSKSRHLPNPANQREWPRRKVLWFGRLTVSDHIWDVRVCDIAASGAKIKMDLPLREGAEIDLFHERFGRLSGHVVWQDDGELGLAFDANPNQVLKAFGTTAAVLGLAS